VRNTVRGLHYQIRQPQGKLVRAVAGEIFDVVVDIRRSSPTFGRWVGETLSAENKKMMWIPGGLAHGFAVLSEYADFLYKTTDYWAPQHERTLLWNDPDLAIAWPLAGEAIVAAKDRAGKRLSEAEVFD
jgi:dTDP-4-dehydrorhamnose 3,5-epimerase